MAKVTRPDTVTVELTRAELALIKDALATERSMATHEDIPQITDLIADLNREN
jgi:hypothetical protein